MSGQDLRTNPYVGLRPFFIHDSLYFFGREEQTAELLAILRQHRFLGVVGSSGSGKSSLVRAGLLPGLLGGFLVHDRDRWRSVQMKPGDAPMANLAVGLLEAMGQTPTAATAAALEQELREGHTDAVVAFLTERLEPNANLFLLVDQFEEIFAFRGLQDDDVAKSVELARRQERARRKAEAADFVDLMLALAEQRALPIYVTLTMRTDFLGDCDLFYGLPEALNRGRYLVPRMTREQLRDAVECPALLLAAEIAPRLLDHVLNELGDRFDRLPVLQHALLRTFDEWQRAGGIGPVDLRHYESAGGLEHALDQDAEGALQGLDLGVTARAFKRLTDTDASQRRVRSPARITELMAVARAERDEIEEIVRRFEEDGRSFLHQSADGKPDDPRVDISHESLIRQWNRLRTWVDEERASRDRYKKLVERAQAGARILDPELQRVLDWWTDAAPSHAWAQRYSTDDEDFGLAERCLRDSAAARDAELERERQRAEADRLTKERELEQAKALAEAQRQRAEEQAAAGVRQRRLNRGLGVSLLVALATVVVAFGLYRTANRALVAAERARQQSLSQQLMAEAGAEIERGAIQLGMLLGATAIRPDSSRQMQEGLRRVLLAQPNLSRVLSGHEDVVTSVAFTPDGRTLASGSLDGSVVLWDLERGTPRGEPLAGNNGSIRSVAFSPDGQMLASANDNGTVTLWNVADRKQRGGPLTRHKGPVTSVAFSQDGKTLASASEGDWEDRRPGAKTPSDPATLVLWDVANGRGVSFPGHDSAIGVAFSPDGKTLASVGVDRNLEQGSLVPSLILWDVTHRRARVPEMQIDLVPSSIAISPDGNTFAIAFAAGFVRLGNLATGRFLHPNPLFLDEGATSIAFSAHGRMLAVASTDGTVARWDLENLDVPRDLQPLRGHAEYATSVAFSADGQTFASASEDRTVIVWDVTSRRALAQPLENHGGYVRSVAFSPDSRILATASDAGTVMLWDVATRQALGQPLNAHREAVRSVAFSRDGKTLASGSADGTVILWDVASRQPMGPPLQGHTDFVRAVAFSPDGQLLASASDDATIILWDVAKRQRVGEPLKGHTDYARSVAFSPDGQLLASSSDDGTVILWNVATRQAAGPPLEGHRNYVTTVAFSPDGRTIASGSDDRTVILWDMASHRTFGQPLKAHEDFVTSVAFSPDGLQLASGSADRTALLWTASLWRVDLDAWVAALCARANRNLTLAEWSEYVSDVPYRMACTNLPGPTDRGR